MDIDLRQLRYVAAVEQYGTYTRAAEALGISQPTLSRSVQALETALGALVFDRTRTGVIPTAVGRIVLDRAARVLHESGELMREVQLAMAVEIGHVRVGVGPYPAEISVGQAAGRHAARHPDVKVELVVGHWEALGRRVAAGELDFAVMETSSARSNPRLEIELLPRHQGRFFCRPDHPLADRRGLAFEDIAAYPWASPTLPERMPKSPRIIRADTFQLAKHVVMESDALGLALPAMIRAELQERRLVLLTANVPWLMTNYGFVRLADRTASPAALALMAAIREVEAEIKAKATEGERSAGGLRPGHRQTGNP